MLTPQPLIQADLVDPDGDAHRLPLRQRFLHAIERLAPEVLESLLCDVYPWCDGRVLEAVGCNDEDEDFESDEELEERHRLFLASLGDEVFSRLGDWMKRFGLDVPWVREQAISTMYTWAFLRDSEELFRRASPDEQRKELSAWAKGRAEDDHTVGGPLDLRPPRWRESLCGPLNRHPVARRFGFDMVYDPTTTTRREFEAIVRLHLDNFLDDVHQAATRKGLRPPNAIERKADDRHVDWLVLTRVKGLKPLHLQLDGVDVSEQAVWKAVAEAASLVGLPARRPGRPPSKAPQRGRKRVNKMSTTAPNGPDPAHTGRNR